MTFPGPINYRRCCLLLLILTSHYRIANSITVAERPSKERHSGGKHRDNTAGIYKDTAAAAAAAADDDTHPEKVEDEDAENKHFMDVYSLQSGPKQLEFGHVFEDSNVWEQRYEKKDFDGQRYQGKVKWGDKDGGYGEQYWDLNHGGAGESALNNEQNAQYDEMTPAEYAQESRPRTMVYKPMVITVYKNKLSNKKNVRNVRNNLANKRPLLEPTATPTVTVTRSTDKKTAPVLVFDMKTGVVMDESTGNKYILKPIEDNHILINNILP